MRNSSLMSPRDDVITLTLLSFLKDSPLSPSSPFEAPSPRKMGLDHQKSSYEAPACVETGSTISIKGTCFPARAGFCRQGLEKQAGICQNPKKHTPPYPSRQGRQLGKVPGGCPAEGQGLEPYLPSRLKYLRTNLMSICSPGNQKESPAQTEEGACWGQDGEEGSCALKHIRDLGQGCRFG